jgi:uncharacterized protein YndB with AHSA1/START domain
VYRAFLDADAKVKWLPPHGFTAKMHHSEPRWTDRFDDPNLPGEMMVTVRLKRVSVGTDVHIVQEGIPDVIPADACTFGCQESLELLALLVEAEIPD